MKTFPLDWLPASGHAVVTRLAGQAAEDSAGVNPIFFILGGAAIVIVSILGPLSRWHEHHDAVKRRREVDRSAEQSGPPTGTAD